MPKVKLTARSVSSLPVPESGQVDYFDESTPGFAVRVSASGRRSFVLLYKSHGRTRRWTIGQSPDISIADARDKARWTRSKIQLEGYDPAGKKTEARKAGDFARLIDQYIEANEKRLQPSTVSEWKRIATREVKPRLGRFSPKEIARADIREFVRKVDPEGKRPVMTNRVYEFVRTVFSWAIAEDLIDANPCTGLKRHTPETPRERTLSSEELEKVWKALDEVPPAIAAVFKFILYTATRRSEALGARWEDIDFKQRLWTIPTTKTGRKHVIPLSQGAANLLESVKPSSGHTPYCFIGVKGSQQLTTVQKHLNRIREQSGVDFRLHDLRRTSATMLGDLEVHSDVISSILNHVVKGPAATRTYERSAKIPQMRRALEALARHIERIVTGEESTVVSFPGVGER